MIIEFLISSSYYFLFLSLWAYTAPMNYQFSILGCAWKSMDWFIWTGEKSFWRKWNSWNHKLYWLWFWAGEKVSWVIKLQQLVWMGQVGKLICWVWNFELRPDCKYKAQIQLFNPINGFFILQPFNGNCCRTQAVLGSKIRLMPSWCT